MIPSEYLRIYNKQIAYILYHLIQRHSDNNLYGFRRFDCCSNDVYLGKQTPNYQENKLIRKQINLATDEQNFLFLFYVGYVFQK